MSAQRNVADHAPAVSLVLGDALEAFDDLAGEVDVVVHHAAPRADEMIFAGLLRELDGIGVASVIDVGPGRLDGSLMVEDRLLKEQS